MYTVAMWDPLDLSLWVSHEAGGRCQGLPISVRMQRHNIRSDPYMHSHVSSRLSRDVIER